MSYKREIIIKHIADNLAFSSESTARKNVIGLLDSNRIAQDFFADLFSLVFGYLELKELDKLNNTITYPAIDLGDEDAKIAFQITTNKDSEKIKETIQKFINHKLYEKYDRLVFFIIGKKQNSYTTTFDTQNKFSFNKETDVWDDDFLIKEINKITDISTLEDIQTFLERNLLEYKFPENLLDQDIKKCIVILKRDFGSSDLIDNILGRGQDFIVNKNKKNNISLDFFNTKIKGHVAQHNKDIVDFLQNPINQKVQQDYLQVSQAIQDFYKNSSNDCTSFEEIFRKVFDKCNILYDDNLNKVKIMILLHNMYFNCDIGHNPNTND